MKRYFYSLALIFLAGIFHAGIEAKDPGSAGGQVLGIGADARAAALFEEGEDVRLERAHVLSKNDGGFKYYVAPMRVLMR